MSKLNFKRISLILAIMACGVLMQGAQARAVGEKEEPGEISPRTAAREARRAELREQYRASTALRRANARLAQTLAAAQTALSSPPSETDSALPASTPSN